jgi:uncharacterized protein with NRDE domain
MNRSTTDEASASRSDGPGFANCYFDWQGDEPLSELVLECIADATGREPASLAPLYESVDPDALDTIFAPTCTSGSRAGGVIELEHEGCHVMVHNEGRLDVRELTHRESG